MMNEKREQISYTDIKTSCRNRTRICPLNEAQEWHIGNAKHSQWEKEYSGHDK